MSAQSEIKIGAAVALGAAVVFYLTTKPVHQHFDYTFRIAEALLRGQLSISSAPSWLNEMVPMQGRFYSVFPLGAVLCNVPLALLHVVGLIKSWPVRELAAVLAGGCVWFAYRLGALRPEQTTARRVVLALFPVFASWTWTNLGLGGAWQIALGFALLGELAAIYYTLVTRRPWLTGIWLAVAIGNRTELVLLLPLFAWLWGYTPARWRDWRQVLRASAGVFAPTLLLLAATALYNAARFGSPLDFGYARIPGVLNEPWYRGGIFYLGAIHWNSYEMLFRGLIDMKEFPFLRPHAFGCSIFLACPFLFLLFREGGKHAVLCWCAILPITFALWLHGNTGGWQFSYRYGMTLLPWMLVIVLENGPPALRTREAALFVISVGINALATYEFLWTNLIRP